VINDLKKDAEQRMARSVEALHNALNRIRTGRAHPSILDSIRVNYYGNDVPINQVANVTVEEARMLVITPWERNMVQEIERAIMKSDLGINPSSAGQVIRVPMPPLTEETRKGFIKQARHEAEEARVSVRNIRRDVNGDIKDLLKEKMISEDEDRRAHEDIQKITDRFVAEIDHLLAAKEKDLMAI
jgi:ribosome recycling factor